MVQFTVQSPTFTLSRQLSWGNVMALSEAALSEHYKKLAPQFDKFYEVQSYVQANFIQHSIPLTKDDQLVDIGGGTGQISRKIHSNLGMTTPVVCIDPSLEMLDVARKNGAITVQSTAESFLASKPDYPLKVIMMTSCVHHFDLKLVFSKLAEYMPKDGVCIATEFAASSLPMFKAAPQAFGGISAMLDSFSEVVESSGLKWKMVSASESGEVSKAVWYDAIRNRFTSALLKFSDEELEEGIEELEEQFKGKDMLGFEIVVNGFIITKM